MFNRILIANRGEIAVRIIRACHELGIEAVAVYSQADCNALHVRMADYRVCIGKNTPLTSYLNSRNVLQAAIHTNAEAIHPGFGFLSENPEFAAMCEDIGIKFIGPNSDTIRKLGQKAVAKKIMGEHGVPTVPGPAEAYTQASHALEVAETIGFPVIIKACSGGGGRGIRVIEKEKDFIPGFQEASHEAKISFNDPSIYVEKYLANPKHIEFQILADEHGNCVHLGERDCSSQRRKQKIIEESPSPAISPTQREEMGAILTHAMRKIGYHNAGTVEFLYEDGRFYFMEVNTRIQVEHPVTELVTSTDLIKEQIRIAGGEPLSWTQEQIRFNGHAIECRLNAENPAKGFMPSAGTITHLMLPGGNGIRVDTAVWAGATIPQFYDSMIAKILALGDTREEAIAKMIRALNELEIEGIACNRDFILRILTSPDFLNGTHDINFVERTLL